MQRRQRNYWAFLANPKDFNIEKAIQELEEDSWTVPGRDVRTGDRAIIWKAKGNDSQRGIVALAEVLTDPIRAKDRNEEHWVDQQRANEEVDRVQVRYYLVPSILPLWNDRVDVPVLKELSVDRARGGTVFHVTSDQWNTIMEHVGGWPGSAPEVESVGQELDRRRGLWEQLLKKGGPRGVAASTLRELGIYNGAQGIWVDKTRTGNIVQPNHGVAVSLTHSGTSYPDDWSDDGVIYHYPETRRPDGRDLSEIEATKNAQRLGLPVFVITHPSHSKRDIYIGRVIDWDDTSKQFLIIFDENFSMKNTILDKSLETIDKEAEFELFQKEERANRIVKGRNNQQAFKFGVLKRYGPRCAVCGIDVSALLQAAHIVPKGHYGSDDARNGLPLCANHHLAFDTYLFVIKSETFEICYPHEGIDAKALQIPFNDLRHLLNLPHNDAIKWRYDHWRKTSS